MIALALRHVLPVELNLNFEFDTSHSSEFHSVLNEIQKNLLVSLLVKAYSSETVAQPVVIYHSEPEVDILFSSLHAVAINYLLA